MPNFVVQALQGEALTVYGNGSQSRSLCYVDDTVRGVLRLLDSGLAETFRYFSFLIEYGK